MTFVRLATLSSLSLLVCFAHTASPAAAQGYRIERIASGLNQPTFVTQAPGDPANILYFTERTSNTIGGFGAFNEMGKIWRYDVTTQARDLVLDLSNRFVFNDTGLQTIAFHPDFNNPVTDGYQKFYLSLSEPGPSATNKVEEYTIGGNGAATFDRIILQYTNNTQNNHTVDWIGFDPTATAEERDYLYISTGDGSFGNAYSDGLGRPSQNPNSVAGKMLRVDVFGADAYPGDPLKNFAIPADNPIPVYNAAHPDAPLTGLGEVWLTGLRNTYRASFDRETGDLWMGDVGEFDYEEVNFLKAGSNTDGPPRDFGWPLLEATHFSGVSGAPKRLVNPFTQELSINPVQEFDHSTAAAAIGGYLYHGPVKELQGKYFYSNFVGTGQIWMLDFDRDTDPSTFNGDNGTNVDVSDLWQSLVVDPNDPSYEPSSSIFSLEGLDHIVSFGEDNAGNLYIVDFGNRSVGQSGFDGQYPNAGLGEIFRITPVYSADFDNDGDVDEDDLAIWQTAYGNTALGDANDNGESDAEDFLIWQREYTGQVSQASSAQQVPEPAAFLLSILGLPFLLSLRK